MTNFRETSWAEFTNRAVPAYWLAEYKYCPSKAVLEMEVEEEKPQQLVKGQNIHEQEAREILESLGPLVNVPHPETVEATMSFSHQQLSRALRERVTLANAEGTIMFVCIVPDLGVWGIPDCADCTNGKHPVIIETKTTGRLPNKPWDDAQVQIGVYMLGLEVLGFDCKYGLLRYKLRQKPEAVRDFRVSLDHNLRQLVEQTAASARQVLDGAAGPAAADTPGKCASCKTSHPLLYRHCRQKLV